MGILLDKIQEHKACGFADSRKTSNSTIPRADSVRIPCGKEKEPTVKSANPQSVRTLKPPPHIAFHKSASPHGVSVNFENKKPEVLANTRNEIRAYQSDLVRMAIQSGVFSHGCRLHEKEVATLIPPSDLRDIPKCEPGELQAWADALAMRAVRYRGKIPAGWDQIAQCANCGPVYSFASGDCLACPWCEMNRAGKWFPVPNT